jgi:hypothetical protein
MNEYIKERSKRRRNKQKERLKMASKDMKGEEEKECHERYTDRTK